MRLAQIGRSPAEHLDFLLEQPVALPQLPQLNIPVARRQRPRLDRLTGGAGTGEPLRVRHRVNPEITRDLLDRHSQLTTLRNTHNVVAELLRIGPRHDGIRPPPSRASQIRCHPTVQQTLMSHSGQFLVLVFFRSPPTPFSFLEPRVPEYPAMQCRSETKYLLPVLDVTPKAVLQMPPPSGHQPDPPFYAAVSVQRVRPHGRFPGLDGEDGHTGHSLEFGLHLIKVGLSWDSNLQAT